MDTVQQSTIFNIISKSQSKFQTKCSAYPTVCDCRCMSSAVLPLFVNTSANNVFCLVCSALFFCSVLLCCVLFCFSVFFCFVLYSFVLFSLIFRFSFCSVAGFLLCSALFLFSFVLSVSFFCSRFFRCFALFCSFF